MKCDAEGLKAILAASRSEAVKRLIAQEPAQFDRAEIADIEIELLKAAPQKANFGDLLVALRQMLASRDPERSAGNMPRVALNYPNPSNPFADGILVAEATCRQAAEWLEKRLHTMRTEIASSESTPSLRSIFAMFIVATVLEFDTLHIDFIPALLEALQHGRPIVLRRSMIGISLRLPFGQQENAEGRMLFVRGRPAILLRKLMAHPGFPSLFNTPAGAGANRLQAAVNRAVDQEIATTEGAAKGFTHSGLLRSARQLALTQIPPIVARHRRRDIVSHSLGPLVIARIQGSRAALHEPLTSRTQAESSADDATDETESEAVDFEPVWMVQLRKALKKDRIDRGILQSLASGAEINERRVAEFALSLSTRLKPSSVQRYAMLIATRVMPRFECCDPLDVDKETWEEVVEQVLDEDVFFHRETAFADRTPEVPGHSIALIKALRHFFRFLNPRRKEALHLKGLLCGSGLLKVDANMITIDEYKRALDWLSGPYGFSDPHLRITSRIILILGYRCGLRRAEVAYLRVCDFDSAFHLHVRPWLMRKLKTSNARRDLPLRVLLPTEELKEVLEFVTSVRNRAGSNRGEVLLLSAESDPRAPINFKQLIAHVHRAIRTATGDESLHYHHLRHSFANIILLKLWPALHPVGRQVFRNHPEMLAWFDEPESFRRQLFGTPATTGSDLQAIAILMGHGRAATTLEHYIHVLDWYTKPDRRSVF
jgi:integrase